MDHAHHWRATSKVFARVCDCGLAYHDWLLMENEWLLTEVDRLKAAAPTTPGPNEDVVALRVQLEEARSESVKLRAELAAAKRELEERAAQVTAKLG